MKKIILLLIFLILLIPSQLFALAAFPGAEGMGANSVGGRGGSVLKVINLNDDGAGSFRAACEAEGARFVVFEVSGIINLDSIVEIDDPYITIAGETSPGGICISGYPVRVFTHDVIITHMRFRRGSHKGDTETEGESLYIGDGYNVIIDHCSMSWGTDETMQVGSYWGDVYGVTISWSIISEGLNELGHGFGLLVSDKFYTTKPPEVTVHHNYLCHHYNRSPKYRGDLLIDHRNNVYYDWYHQQGPRLILGAIDNDNLPRANIVSNFGKNGVNGNENGCAGFFSSNALTAGVPAGAKNTVYVSDNRGCGRPLGSEGEWQITKEWGSNLISDDYQKGTAWVLADEAQEDGVAVTTTTMTAAYASTILETVGATAPIRDTVDTRVIAEYEAGTGTIIDDVTYPNDWPEFETPSAPTDSDSDGMSDVWETTNFGDLSETATGDFDSDGYNNIEEYFEYLRGEESNSVTLTGTLADGATEAEVKAGSLTIIGTISGDILVATFGADNQITTDFIAGIDSGGAEAGGWDAVVKAALNYTHVSRDSDTQFTVTTPAAAGYAITTNETITVTVPATSLEGGVQVVATPTFEITATDIPIATISGSLSDNALETEIVTGGEDLIITLTYDTWVPDDGTFAAARQAIIDGLTSAQSETYGWNNEVRDKEVVGAVVRTSDTVVTITFSAAPDYDISDNESVSVTIPAAALTSGEELVPVPSQFSIIFFTTTTEKCVGMTLQ